MTEYERCCAFLNNNGIHQTEYFSKYYYNNKHISIKFDGIKGQISVIDNEQQITHLPLNVWALMGWLLHHLHIPLLYNHEGLEL